MLRLILLSCHCLLTWFFKRNLLFYYIVNWITMTRKSGEHWPHDIRKRWTAVLTLLGLISSVHRNLKKENLHLHPCPWSYDNYADPYFQSSWEDAVLEVTVSSVKNTDVTCKTHSGWLAAQLPWLVSLTSLVYDVHWWLSGRVLISFLFVHTFSSPAFSSNIHRYFNNTFHEFKHLKKVIITETFNVNFYNRFIKFCLFLFFLLFFIYIYIYIYEQMSKEFETSWI